MYEARAYKIWYEDAPETYVGSTKQQLCKRMSNHRSCARTGKSKVYKWMWENGLRKFKHVLLESRLVSCYDE